jgi:hypothetical protein
MSNKGLTERETKILRKLLETPEQDVRIGELYAITGHPKWKPPRAQQQFLGAYFSRINVKIAGMGAKIETGEGRGTYRIVQTDATKTLLV